MKVKFIETKTNPDFYNKDGTQNNLVPQAIAEEYIGIVQSYIPGDSRMHYSSYAIVLVGNKLLTVPTANLIVIEE